MKHEVIFIQVRRSRVFVDADDRKAAEAKAIKICWKDGQLNSKYIFDDDARLESIKCLVS
jgi:hypothetical protein